MSFTAFLHARNNYFQLMPGTTFQYLQIRIKNAEVFLHYHRSAWKAIAGVCGEQMPDFRRWRSRRILLCMLLEEPRYRCELMNGCDRYLNVDVPPVILIQLNLFVPAT